MKWVKCAGDGDDGEDMGAGDVEGDVEGEGVEGV